MTAAEAVWQAMTAMGGERSIEEVRDWIEARYPNQWVDIGTTMADLTSPGNVSSSYSEEQRFLERISIGRYRVRQAGRFLVGT